MTLRLPVAAAALALLVSTAPALAQATAPSVAQTAAPAAQSAKASPTPSPTPPPPYTQVHWREIGPAAGGGRVAAVAGTAANPNLYYLGAAGGGVWKSSNGGQTWTSVWGKQDVGSIGAVAIDPTNQKTVWVGTGETNPRNDVSYGDGIYKTTDGGKTWKKMGLAATKYIARILIDPNDPNHVIVAALGDVFADSTHRGIYVTNDGGKTWKHTLYVGPESGGSDLAASTQNPNVVYAGIWKFQRRPWTFTSGGNADGIYKSTDGGNTWTKLHGHGLPSGKVGRIGLAVAPSNGNRVYALIESTKGILWRSDDAGAHWKMVSDNTLVDQRPFYFTHIAVDPKNPNKVYGVSEMLSMSTDGGKHFKAIANAVHVDYHAIWIAPNDPSRIIVGEDGGYALTVDGGANWFFSANLPIAQVYRVGLGNDNPFTVCAGLQDNNAWCGPSNSLDPSGIQNKNWIVSAGGDGEWAIPEPDDANWIWSDSEDGALQVYNRVTQDTWSAQPYLQTSKESFDLASSKYRFNWESPIAFAPWNPRVAWYGGDVIFQSTDRGRHWSVISPDLTRNDKAHQQPSGGPITNDVSGAEYSDTILDIEGSTLAKGEIWVGTDDGLVQLTRDDGKHWTNVTPPGAPKYGRFATVAPSTISDGTAYTICDGHYLGDNAPYAWVTHDFGRHWTKITNGLPADQWVRAIRPDIHNPNIVYLGLEEGIDISFDGGATWKKFNNGIPAVSVHDIRMQPRTDSLVIATHGRAVYVMDDMRPIQNLGSAMAKGAAFFAPHTAYEWSLHSNDEGTYTNYAAANPPYGVVLSYYQRAPAKTAPKLEILDRYGRAIRTIDGTHKVGKKELPRVPNKAGINQFVWDFQIDGPVKWYGAARKRYQGPNEGPGVPPGTYSARLTLGSKVFVQPFIVKPDPRSQFTQAEYEQTYELSRRVQDQFSQVDLMLDRLDDVDKALSADAAAAAKAKNAALSTAIGNAQSARTTLFNSLTANYHNDEDSIERQGALREDIETAYYSAQGLVTQPVLDYVARTTAELAAAKTRFNAFVTGVLPGVNAALKAANMKPLPTVAEMH